VDEQKRFLAVAERSHNYFQYALILETGLRTGELIGLTWDAIDFKKRTLTVNKTLEYRYKQKDWRAGPPKTPQSCPCLSTRSSPAALPSRSASRAITSTPARSSPST
jgi:integrase